MKQQKQDDVVQQFLSFYFFCLKRIGLTYRGGHSLVKKRFNFHFVLFSFLFFSNRSYSFSVCMSKMIEIVFHQLALVDTFSLLNWRCDIYFHFFPPFYFLYSLLLCSCVLDQKRRNAIWSQCDAWSFRSSKIKTQNTKKNRNILMRKTSHIETKFIRSNGQSIDSIDW